MRFFPGNGDDPVPTWFSKGIYSASEVSVFRYVFGGGGYPKFLIKRVRKEFSGIVS